jgi:hypothetical protein
MTMPLHCAGAGVELVQKAGGKEIEAACIIELPELKGREKLEDLPLFVLVEQEGLRRRIHYAVCQYWQQRN